MLGLSVVSAVIPFGVEEIVEVNSTRAAIDVADSHQALAGNVTELEIFGYTITQSWQGYFGNVSGTIMLADVDDNVMYNWSLADPEGEVYASRIPAVDWASIQCFNFDADNSTPVTDGAAPGETNLNGRNLAWVEEEYGIEWDAVDGFNETFSLTGNPEVNGTPGNNLNHPHDLFYTNNIEFSEGECLSTQIYSDIGGPTLSEFQQILLYDSANHDLVYTALIEEESVLGFDGRDHDFQLMVPEDGHGTDIVTTTYYFYVELE